MRTRCVVFPGLRFTTRADGVSSGLSEALQAGRWWRFEVAPPSVDVGPRLTVALERDRGRREPPRCRPGEVPHTRRLPITGGDVVSLAGGQVRITSGGGEVIVAPWSRSIDHLAALQLLMDTALVHSLALQGGCVLHAAGIEIDGRGVLVLGASGSGKSSVAVAAMGCGGRVVSDDALVAGAGDGDEPVVVPFRRDVYIRHPSERLLSRSASQLLCRVELPGEKSWILHRRSSPGSFVAGMCPEVVWQVVVDRRLNSSRIEPISRARTMVALVRNANPLYLSAHYPAERAALMPLLQSLADGCGGFRVRLGRDLLEDPTGTMGRLLARSG